MDRIAHASRRALFFNLNLRIFLNLWFSFLFSFCFSFFPYFFRRNIIRNIICNSILSLICKQRRLIFIRKIVQIFCQVSFITNSIFGIFLLLHNDSLHTLKNRRRTLHICKGNFDRSCIQNFMTTNI